MNFKQKRMSYGLEAYTVAKELGIPYTKYLEVEKGNLDLDTNKKEKFRAFTDNDIVSNCYIRIFLDI